MVNFGGGDWLLPRARLIWKTERRRWKVRNVTLGFLFHLIFGADFFPFTNSDIYGFLRTINATEQCHSLSKKIHFAAFKTNIVFFSIYFFTMLSLPTLLTRYLEKTLKIGEFVLLKAGVNLDVSYCR